MTSTGVFFILTSILGSLKYKYLVFLLLLSSIFQAAAVVNIGTKGIPIFSFVEIIFIIVSVLKISFCDKGRFFFDKQQQKIYIALFILLFWGVLSAFLFPTIFSGIHVFVPRLGLDAQYGYGNQGVLYFSTSNVAQVVYLFLNISTFILLSSYIKNTKDNIIDKLLIPILVIALIFVFYNVYSVIFTKISFIQTFLYNNLSYAIGDNQSYFLFKRINGSFLEPSQAGAFFASFSAGLFFYKNNIKILILFFLSFVAMLLSTSSTGYVSFFLAIFFISFLKLLYMFSVQRYRLSSFRIKIISLFIGIGLMILIYESEVVMRILNFVLLHKDKSSSFLHRMFADLYALEIFLKTYGLGCGLGSSRSSSFLPTLLSTLGLPGLLLLVISIGLVFKNAIKYIFHDKEILFTFILSITIFISMLVAMPDISNSFFWIFTSLLFGLTLRKKKYVVIN